MNFKVGAIATCVASATTTLVGSVWTKSCLGVVGTLAYTLPCYALNAAALAILKDPSSSTAKKIAALSIDFFGTYMICEATCEALGVNYMDLASLAFKSLVAVPSAAMITVLVLSSAHEISAKIEAHKRRTCFL